MRQAQLRKTSYDGRRYDREELALANALLRLEHTLGAQWWRERVGKAWYDVTADELRASWQAYFGRMLGDVEVSEMNIEDRVHEVAETEGQAKAAIGWWARIKAYGWEKARHDGAAHLVPESQYPARGRALRCRPLRRERGRLPPSAH